jgi:hypothetical protein
MINHDSKLIIVIYLYGYSLFIWTMPQNVPDLNKIDLIYSFAASLDLTEKVF